MRRAGLPPVRGQRARARTSYQKPLMPASQARPCGERQPVARPPGSGAASSSVTA